MARQGPSGRDSGHSDVVDRWFRALDQRRVRIGLHEWRLQVTGIYADHDDVWIQIADGAATGGSVLLRVNSRTTADDALQALAQHAHVSAATHPTVIAATATSASRQDDRTEIAVLP